MNEVAQPYRFEVVQRLDQQALAGLESRHGKYFRRLISRYGADLDDCPETWQITENLDLLRIRWLLDKSWFKPSRRQASSGLGYAFGELLAQRLPMQWCLIRDDYGETLSLVFAAEHDNPERPSTVSFPPFNYVEKREKLLNDTVFSDGLARVRELIYN